MNHLYLQKLNDRDSDTNHLVNFNFSNRLHQEYISPIEYCWNHSYMKISFYSSTDTTIEIEFNPSKIVGTHTNTIDANGIQYGEPIFSLTSITTTINYTDTDEYKHYVLPIKGETVKIKLTKTSQNYTDDTHTHLAVCMTKNFSVVNVA